jgi:signal peptidase I
MEPTILTGDTVTFSRLHYIFSKPSRGEIVIFRPHPSYAPNNVWMHRIVAVPGDKVKIQSGEISVNDAKPYFSHVNSQEDIELTVPAGMYYQKGDGLNSLHGLVESDLIIGKVISCKQCSVF